MITAKSPAALQSMTRPPPPSRTRTAAPRSAEPSQVPETVAPTAEPATADPRSTPESPASTHCLVA